MLILNKLKAGDFGIKVTSEKIKRSDKNPTAIIRVFLLKYFFNVFSRFFTITYCTTLIIFLQEKNNGILYQVSGGEINKK